MKLPLLTSFPIWAAVATGEAGGSVTMQPCNDPANQETICYKECGGPKHPSPYAGVCGGLLDAQGGAVRVQVRGGEPEGRSDQRH